MAGSSYIAFDFGAESGRTLVGTMRDDKIILREIHRFPNPMIKLLDGLHWDVLYLFNELKKGLCEASRQGYRQLMGIGIDTWGVDFGLISKDNHLLGFPYTYRDFNTEGMMDSAFKRVPLREMHEITGLQFLQFNSVFQLFSMVKNNHPWLQISDKLLFMPDLFNFLLTGEKKSEYTIASTSQMLDARNRVWAEEMIKKLGLPGQILAEIIPPGTVVGTLLPELAHEAGLFPVKVIAPACHDTASAVAAVPASGKNWAYLSSGTWSLLGKEIVTPIINESSLNDNFTNEGGIEKTTRFLRNTMGLWPLQQCKNQWRADGKDLDYTALVALAQKAPAFKSLIDIDHHSFFNPKDMVKAIVEFCRQSNQPIPETIGGFVRCILESLAFKYKDILNKMNAITGAPIEVLHVVGGGSKNRMLNQFTANATGLPLIAGPVEATALGNVLVQAIAQKELANIDEGRQLVASSFTLEVFEPKDQDLWQEIYSSSRISFPLK
jgi:rhamnulokinase